MRLVLLVTLLTLGLPPHRLPAQQRMVELSATIRQRIASVPGAEVAVSVRDLATGERLDLGDTVSFHAASTMKLPVMMEVLTAVDEHRLGLDQRVLLVNRFPSIVDGSPYALDAGDDSDSSMYARVGERVPVRELLERMIVRSSNLATNALIALVGAEETTARAHALGATRLQVRRGVEDGKAFAAGLNNVTTSADLATLLERVAKGDALSPERISLMREILLRQEFNDEIPAGVPAGTRVAHKTGSITATLHDAAIVYPAERAPYILVVLTRRIPEPAVARQLIVDISRAVWTSLVSPAMASAPVTTR